jgi:hypothetical protein
VEAEARRKVLEMGSGLVEMWKTGVGRWASGQGFNRLGWAGLGDWSKIGRSCLTPTSPQSNESGPIVAFLNHMYFLQSKINVGNFVLSHRHLF